MPDLADLLASENAPALTATPPSASTNEDAPASLPSNTHDMPDLSSLIGDIAKVGEDIESNPNDTGQQIDGMPDLSDLF